jgi:hypothetical protein
MTLRKALLAAAAALSVFVACRGGGRTDSFCAGPDAYVYAPNKDCGTGITALEVEAPCTATCDDPGYAECPGPCIVWKISAPKPATCRFIVHFKSAADFSAEVSFVPVTATDRCNDQLMASSYYLPNGLATRSADASVEASASPNDAALEADTTDASSDGADGG